MSMAIAVASVTMLAAGAPARVEEHAKQDDVTIRACVMDLKNANDAAARFEALRRLHLLGPAAAEAAAAIIEYIAFESTRPGFNAREDYGILTLAGDVLSAMGPEVTPVLISALGHDDDFVRYEASRALVSFGPVAGPALLAVLREDDARGLRHAGAAGVIAEMEGVAPVAVVESLLAALKDSTGKEAGVRIGLIEALGHFGADARAAVPLLVDRLSDREEVVQSSAVDALAKIGVRERDDVLALGTLVRDIGRPGQRAAARVLATLGGAALPALGALMEALESACPEVAQAAVEAIGEIGPDARAATAAVQQLQQKAEASGRTHLAVAAAKVLSQLQQPRP